MGGYGSGRSGNRYTVEDLKDIDINWLKRKEYIKEGYHTSGSLHWSRGGKPSGSIGFEVRMDVVPAHMRLCYTFDKTEDIDYQVSLTKTSCNYGGYRWWFICPSCGKRVGKLYGGKFFYCRICHDLTYRICNESDSDRMLSKANKIRGRLGVPAGSINPILFKPKGMHRKTFDRLRCEVLQLEDAAWRIAGRRIGMDV